MSLCAFGSKLFRQIMSITDYHLVQKGLNSLVEMQHTNQKKRMTP